MLLSIQSINHPIGRALSNHQSDLRKKKSKLSVKHIASVPSVGGILSSGFPAFPQSLAAQGAILLCCPFYFAFFRSVGFVIQIPGSGR